MPFEALTLRRGWNAATNSPALVPGRGENGAAYVVSTAGATDLGQGGEWNAGDIAAYALDRWVRIPTGGRGEQNGPLVYLCLEGCRANGVDHTATLQGIVDKYGAATYVLDPAGDGDFVTDTRVEFPIGAVIRLAGRHVRWVAGQLRWRGSLGEGQALTSTTARGSPLFSVADNSFVAKGDYIMAHGIVSLGIALAGQEQLAFRNSTAAIWAGEPFLVNDVSTPGQIVTWAAPRWTYDHEYPDPETLPTGDPSASTVHKITWATGGIEGPGTIVAKSNVAYTELLTLEYARDFYVEGVTFDLRNVDAYRLHTDWFGMANTFRGNVVLANPYLKALDPDQEESSTLRNLITNRGGHGNEISGNTFYGGNQVIDLATGGPKSYCFRGIRVFDNRVFDANEAFTTHWGGLDVLFYRNYARTIRGFRIRTPDTAVVRNVWDMLGNPAADIGVYLVLGFFNGVTVAGNILRGGAQGIGISYSNNVGTVPDSCCYLTDNDIYGSLNLILITVTLAQANDKEKAIIISGGKLEADPVLTARYINLVEVDGTDSGAFINGLSIDRVVFRGPLNTSQNGAIRLRYNMRNLTIGTNIFENVGIPALYGPGANAITNTDVFTGGNADANWLINGQILKGTTTAQSSNLPTAIEAYRSLASISPLQGPLKLEERTVAQLPDATKCDGLRFRCTDLDTADRGDVAVNSGSGALKWTVEAIGGQWIVV